MKAGRALTLCRIVRVDVSLVLVDYDIVLNEVELNHGAING